MISSRGWWLLLWVSAIGCGTKTGDVSGTVEFKGRALNDGRVTFYCEGGEKPVLISQISNGNYSIVDAPLGQAKITVETFEHRSTPVPGQINSPDPIGDSEDSEESEPTERITNQGNHVALPARYSSPDSSNLSLEIQPGKNLHALELQE